MFLSNNFYVGLEDSEVVTNLTTSHSGNRFLRQLFVSLFISTDRTSELVYFFIPVLVLVVCNVILFSVTAYRIRSIRQETAILKSAESSRSDKLKKDKQR